MALHPIKRTRFFVRLLLSSFDARLRVTARHIAYGNELYSCTRSSEEHFFVGLLLSSFDLMLLDAARLRVTLRRAMSSIRLLRLLSEPCYEFAMLTIVGSCGTARDRRWMTWRLRSRGDHLWRMYGCKHHGCCETALLR